LPDKVDPDVVERRRARIADLVEELMAQRAAERIGEQVHVLVEGFEDGTPVGRAAHQGPDDGICMIVESGAQVGDWVVAQVVDSEGVDLMVRT
jgi:tRNA A37 methylthiotransferase MiaB